MLNSIVILAQEVAPGATPVATPAAPATTASADGTTSTTGTPPSVVKQEPTAPGWVGMLPIFVIFGVMIFFMMRSQKKQAQKRKEMLNAIQSGDRIVTNGGIKGTIVKVNNDFYLLEIANGVQIEIVHAAVGQILGKDNNE